MRGLSQLYWERAQAQGVVFVGPSLEPSLKALTEPAYAVLLERLMRVLLDNALEAMPGAGS